MRGQVEFPPRFGVLTVTAVGIQLSEHSIERRRSGYNLPDEIVYVYKRFILLGEGATGDANAAIMTTQLQPVRKTVGGFLVVCLDAGVVPGPLYLPGGLGFHTEGIGGAELGALLAVAAEAEYTSIYRLGRS